MHINGRSQNLSHQQNICFASTSKRLLCILVPGPKKSISAWHLQAINPLSLSESPSLYLQFLLTCLPHTQAFISQYNFPCWSIDASRSHFLVELTSLYVHTALQELALKSISEQLLLPAESPLVAFCLLTECLGFGEEAHIYLSCPSMRIPVSNKSLCFRANFPYRSLSLLYLYCCLTRCRH